MGWLKDHLGVRFDSHTLGNVLKNVSPAIAFTPAGVLGSGVTAALGERLRGKTNIGDIVKAGASNAAIGGGTAALAGKVGIGTGAHLGFGLGEGSTAAANAPAAPTAPTGSAVTDYSGVEGGAPGAPTSNPSGLFSRLGSAVEHHSNAVAMGLNAASQIPQIGSGNRLRDAQTNALTTQTGAKAYDLDRQKQVDTTMDPYRSAVFARLAQLIAQPRPT